MSDAACGWSWETCLELQSDPQFVAASAGPGVHGKDQTAPQYWFYHHWAWGQAKVPRHPEIYFCPPPPANYVLGSVTKSTSGSTQII